MAKWDAVAWIALAQRRRPTYGGLISTMLIDVGNRTVDAPVLLDSFRVLMFGGSRTPSAPIARLDRGHRRRAGRDLRPDGAERARRHLPARRAAAAGLHRSAAGADRPDPARATDRWPGHRTGRGRRRRAVGARRRRHTRLLEPPGRGRGEVGRRLVPHRRPRVPRRRRLPLLRRPDQRHDRHRRGERVPAMVEQHLAGCPHLAEVAVIGSAHERWVEQVTAVVVPVRPGVTADDVAAWCAANPNLPGCTGRAGSRSSTRCRAPAAASSTGPSCGSCTRDGALHPRGAGRVADHRPARGPQRAVRGGPRGPVGRRAPVQRGRRRGRARAHRRGRQGVLRGRRPQGDGRRGAGGAAAGLPPAVRPQHRRAPSRRSRPSTASPTRAGSCWRSSATWWWPPSTPRSRSPRSRWAAAAPWAAPLPWLVPPARRHGDPAHRRPDRARRGRTRSGWSTRWSRPPSCTSATQALAERIAANAPLSVRAGQAHRVPVGDPPRGGLDAAEEIWAPVYRSADAQEGPRAFRGEAHARLAGPLTCRLHVRARRRPRRRVGGAARAARRRSTRRAGGTPTPAAGWTVRDQVTHLAYFDETAAVRRGRPRRFRPSARCRAGDPTSPTGSPPRTATCPAPAVLRLVRRRPVPATRHVPRARPVGARALVRAADERRVVGSPRGSWRRGRTARTSPTPSACAAEPDRPAAARRPHRGRAPRASPSCVHGRPVPDDAVPGGARRARRRHVDLGPEDAADRVTGPALDFCLLVTQRRHRADPALVVERPGRDRVADFAQAFAGRPAAAAGRPRQERRMRPVRIANCSGFYGDRLAAAREMVDGGPIDVLTGDYLAELDHAHPGQGAGEGPRPRLRAHVPHARSRRCSARASSAASRSSSNAGGLNPAGLRRSRRRSRRSGRRVAHVEGDDLRGSLGAITPPVSGKPVSANAYLGGWGIAARWRRARTSSSPAGSPTPSLVVGPAAWWHGWGRDRLGRARRRGRRRARDRVRRRRPPAATTRSSTRSPTGATRASRSPRSPPTARR